MGTELDHLKASALTPDLIRQKSKTPKESFKILMLGYDATPDKLKALIERPDVSGFLAHQFLKETANHGGAFFTTFLDLYIKKFILKGSEEDSLCYTIMTLQLWIHFIGSSDEEGYKPNDVRYLLPQISLVLVRFINHWPKYKTSAVTLMNRIEEYFLDGSYNGENKFPGDKEPPFRFSFDDYIRDELKRYILPFIGSMLRSAYLSEKYYQTSEDAFALATREFFGSPKEFGSVYIKSVENTFDLSDINHFVPGEEMEKFLLSPEGATANTRFCNLCENYPANKMLEFIGYRTNYAAFYFKDNKEYQKLSLEEKADFLKPFSSRLESNHRNKQQELLRIWINDPEWNNPERLISELTLLTLKKRHLFSHNSQWLFNEMIEIIFRRKYGEEVPAAKIKNEKVLNMITNGGTFIDEEKYPDEFMVPESVLTMFNAIEERKLFCSTNKIEFDWYSRYTNEHIINAIMKLFFQHLCTCLPDYDNNSACEAVILARACDQINIMELIAKRDLSFDQILNLLEGVETKETNAAIMELGDKLVDKINKIESDKECLQTSIYLVVRYRKNLLPDGIMTIPFSRKSFNDFSLLLTTLEIIMRDRTISLNNRKSHISDDNTELIRKEILNHITSCCKKQNDALMFCQSSLFPNNFKNWSWYYSLYKPKNIDELFRNNLENFYQVFSNSPQRENLLSVWKKTPFIKISNGFIKEFIFSVNIRLHEHPGWKKLSLRKRLDLFDSTNKLSHEKILPSMAEDFELKWKEGNWNKIKYIKAIESLDSCKIDSLAKLALDLIKD